MTNKPMNTVSLEVAKKLKEAGWEKEDDMMDGKYFYRHRNGGIWGELRCYWCFDERNDVRDYEFLPAPQLHEILEVMPDYVEDEYVKSESRWSKGLSMDRDEDTYSFDYCNYEAELYLTTCATSKNPHDAAALLWIYLKENNLLNVSTS